MSKLDKELYIKHAKRLGVIIDPTSPFAKYLTRQDFISGLKIQLNVLAVLEKKFKTARVDDNLKAESLAVKFAELSKTEFKLDDKFGYPEDDDYIDTINYLHTYCKNIFKVDLDDLVEGKKVELAQPEIHLGAEANADAGAGADAESGPNPYMGAAMGAMGGFPGMEGMMNPFAYGQATARLNENIKSGKVYQFNSKPKLIPIIKLILCIMVFLIVASFIVSSVFVFYTNGLSITWNGATQPSQLNTITDGIFYIITAGFGCYVGVTEALQLARSKTNDNMKFSFSWFVYFGFLMLVFLIPLIDVRRTWAPAFSVNDPSVLKNTVGLAWWKILWIVDLALGGLMIIPLVIGAVKAPKVDSSKMEGLLKQYMDEYMSANQPRTGGTTGGADVQKPVDVKPTEDKKPDDTNLKS